MPARSGFTLGHLAACHFSEELDLQDAAAHPSAAAAN
jgi:hypothetical protein